MTAVLEPRRIAFGAVKGGTGTSTVAAVYALALADDGSVPVALVDPSGDIARSYGLPLSDIRSALDSVAPVPPTYPLPHPALALHFCWLANIAGARVAVGDCGRIDTASPDSDAVAYWNAADARVLVTDRSFVALTRYATGERSYSPATAVVACDTADRVLDDRDIAAAVGLELPRIARIDRSATMARASDAGLLLARSHRFATIRDAITAAIGEADR